jgi:hypothetical protein
MVYSSFLQIIKTVMILYIRVVFRTEKRIASFPFFYVAKGDSRLTALATEIDCDIGFLSVNV